MEGIGIVDLGVAKSMPVLKQEGDMNIEEAIESVKGAFSAFDSEYSGSRKESKEIEREEAEVIALLQKGEAYEKMWEELYQDFIKNKYERNITGYSYMVDMDNMKKKYFPEDKLIQE